MNEVTEINKIKSWIIAARPRTLPAAVVPVIVGSTAAYSDNKFILLNAFIALLCSLLIQIGTNFTNDLYDYLKGADNVKRKGPLRVMVNGLITVKEMKAGIAIVFLSAFILGLYLVYSGGIFVLLIGIASILAGIAYTAGPYPLAYNGLGDLFVFMFFGIVGTVGTYYVQAHSLTYLPFLCSIPVGALITNILVVNNYRDIDEDRAANKYTLAVKFGRSFTRYQFIFLLFISFIIPLILFIGFEFSYWVFLPYFTIPMAYNLAKMLYSYEGKDLNRTLELTAKFLAIFGLLFSAGILL
ncbi:MAG: 1,4-dihydroxy-2-naphthoate polyprenyltransferase [Ignavibacteriaceae bacterium]|nr:1,4-dihydroxy-2-naphthoate polyprenyltransferase [Ignavibacteriaceae bacterium]